VQVYEYMDSDLECLIRDRATIISAADVKSYMQMVLKALVVCCKAWILHRDIKPSNFLLSMSGTDSPKPLQALELSAHRQKHTRGPLHLLQKRCVFTILAQRSVSPPAARWSTCFYVAALGVRTRQRPSVEMQVR
jgi:cyclin-dependent kinase 7